MIAPNRRAHVLQHVPFEGLGSIEPWLVTAGYSITWTRFFTGGNLPAPDDPDLLIVLGGPMSVNDEAAFPWLRDEKRFVRRSIETGVPLLGICLGAQLIAAALDARVYPNRHREIGWFPVYRTPDEPGVFPERFDAFHWHGETFDLPSGAALLARSAACEHQAFAVGRSVVGLQFHLETTPASALSLVDNCRDELGPGPFVQTGAAILGAPQASYDRINELMARLLSRIASPAAPPQDTQESTSRDWTARPPADRR